MSVIPEQGNVVGLGIDLMGGPETLQMLRAIRTEMTAIAQLGGRSGGASGSRQGIYAGASAPADVETNLRARERVEAESRRRSAEARVKSEKDITEEEIAIGARASNRKLELNQRINQRAAQLRASEAQQKKQALEDEARAHEQFLSQRKLRIQTYARDEANAQRNYQSDSRRFQRYRNDPARDDQTDVFRKQLAERIEGQRLALREQKRLTDERARLEQNELAVQRQREVERRSLDQNILKRQINLAQAQGLPSSLRNEIQIDSEAQALALRRYRDQRPPGPDARTFRTQNQRIANVNRVVDAGQAAQFNDPLLANTEEARLYRVLYGSQNTYATGRKQELDALVEKRRGSQQNNDYVKNERERQILEAERAADARGYRLAQPPPRPPRPPSGRGPRQPNLNDPQGLYNDRGFFTSADAVGRITRNILLYEVISRATYGLASYIKESIEAAKHATDFANALKFATEQAGGNLVANRSLAESLGQVGLNQIQANQIVATAARATYRHPEQTADLARLATNIAASRGEGIDKAPEVLEEIQQGRDRKYREYFNLTPEEVYKRAARANTTSPILKPLPFGKSEGRDYETDEQRVSRYVSKLTEEEKEQLRLNFAISQSSRFSGDAAERANTLSGQLDKLAAQWTNNQVNLGLFVADLKIVRDLITGVTNRVSIFNALKPPEIGRTGPRGTISNADVTQYGIDRAYGTRADLLRGIDSVGPYAAAGLAGAVGFGLYGRRAATRNVRFENYQRVLSQSAEKFGGDMSAAATEAVNASKDLKPGLIRSIRTGVVEVNTSITRSVGSLLAGATEGLGFDARGIRTATGALSVAQRSAIASNPAYTQGYKDRVLNGSTGLQAGIGTGAGVVGGVIGAGVASFVADKITSNQIIATGITILGGVAGSALGTAAGNVAGGAIGGSIAAAGGLGAFLGGAAGFGGIAAGATTLGVAGLGLATGYGIGSLFAKPVGQLLGTDYGQQDADDRRLQSITESQVAAQEQSRDLLNGLRENRIRYRSLTPGQGPVGQLYSGSQVPGLGGVGDKQGGFKNFERVIISKDEADKELNTIESLKTAIDVARHNPALSKKDQDEFVADYESRIKLVHQYGTTDQKQIAELDDYRQKAAQRESERIQKESAERQKLVTEYANAFAKLREAKQGSFRIPGEVGTSIAGEDNAFVKPLADQITLAERMRQQWGFLGQAAVDYYTTVEQKAVSRRLLTLDFQSYTTASGLRGQADREAAERTGPGLSRRERDYLEIQSAITEKATQIPRLWAEAAGLINLENSAYGRIGLGQSPKAQLFGQLGLISQAFGVRGPKLRNLYDQDVTPDGTIRNDFGQKVGSQFDTQYDRRNVYGQSLVDPNTREIFSSLGRGQSPEVANAVRKSFGETVLEALKEYSPQQIRAAGLQDLYLGAIGIQGQSLNFNISQARRKAEFGAVEDQRLQKQLDEDARFRQAQIASGADAEDVGRASDKLQLARTDNIPVKDLTFEQFRNRQEAQRREADRAEQDRKEAQAAVKEGLKAQHDLVDAVDLIYKALTGPDAFKMLIQVQNDTQARTDQEKLEDIGSGRYNVPLDQSGAKTNPFTPSTARYGRGGRKQ